MKDLVFTCALWPVFDQMHRICYTIRCSCGSAGQLVGVNCLLIMGVTGKKQASAQCPTCSVMQRDVWRCSIKRHMNKTAFCYCVCVRECVLTSSLISVMTVQNELAVREVYRVVRWVINDLRMHWQTTAPPAALEKKKSHAEWDGWIKKVRGERRRFSSPSLLICNRFLKCITLLTQLSALW